MQTSGLRQKTNSAPQLCLALDQHLVLLVEEAPAEEDLAEVHDQEVARGARQKYSSYVEETSF